MLFLGRRRRRRREAKGGPTANWKGGRGFTAVGEKSPGIKAKIIQLQSRESTKMKERKEYFFVVGFHKDVSPLSNP